MPRPRKPTKLKVLEGTYRKDRANPLEPDPPTARPDPPPHLTAAALEEWNGIVPELEAAGLLTKLDRTALAAYCTAFARWKEAEEKLAELGLVVKAPTGYPIQNPYLAIANKALKQLHEFIREFGLSPASRTKTESTKPQAPSSTLARPAIAPRPR